MENKKHFCYKKENLKLEDNPEIPGEYYFFVEGVETKCWIPRGGLENIALMKNRGKDVLAVLIPSEMIYEINRKKKNTDFNSIYTFFCEAYNNKQTNFESEKKENSL